MDRRKIVWFVNQVSDSTICYWLGGFLNQNMIKVSLGSSLQNRSDQITAINFLTRLSVFIIRVYHFRFLELNTFITLDILSSTIIKFLLTEHPLRLPFHDSLFAILILSENSIQRCPSLRLDDMGRLIVRLLIVVGYLDRHCWDQRFG